METFGTAQVADEIPAARAVTATVSREEIAGALQDPDRSPELFLDIRHGEEQSTVGISWSHDELEKLFARATGDDIVLTFDRDELQSLLDDVEAHGFRERALVLTVALAGALGSGATIANAAPTIGDTPGAASIATVENLAAASIDGVASNVHSPGLQTGDVTATASAPSIASEATMASAASIKLATEPQPAAVDSGVASNVHTPGVQIGPEESTATAASIKLSTEPRPAVADSAIVSNVHTPGVQIGPEESTGAAPSVQVSAGSSSGEFLGIDTRDVTGGLIAGGVLLAIAGATFVGTRRPGSARPA